MAETRNPVQDWYANRLREFHAARYQADLDSEEDDEIDPDVLYPRETELSAAAEQPDRTALPQEVAEALAYYKGRVEDQDWGSARVYRVPAGGPMTYAVRVTTDGDDGYLEVYDAGGRFLAAGRTSVERVAWGPRDWVRSQVGQAYPPDLKWDDLPREE